MARNAGSITFAIAHSDRSRLDRLVKKLGGGNRSAFLREAMNRLEAQERAERLQWLQAVGARRSAERGIQAEDVSEIVHRVLAKKPRAERSLSA
jgi:Arc/MetJ-type ribon-helix-helix transcriptional regulator